VREAAAFSSGTLNQARGTTADVLTRVVLDQAAICARSDRLRVGPSRVDKGADQVWMWRYGMVLFPVWSAVHRGVFNDVLGTLVAILLVRRPKGAKVPLVQVICAAAV